MFRFHRFRSRLLLGFVLVSGATASAQDAPSAPATEAPADALPAEPAPVEPAPVAMGTVAGKIIDSATKEGLPAATISIHGASGDQTLVTELDGTFTLQLAPGAYTVTFSTPEY